jgi:hypothetical protein
MQMEELSKWHSDSSLSLRAQFSKRADNEMMNYPSLQTWLWEAWRNESCVSCCFAETGIPLAKASDSLHFL